MSKSYNVETMTLDQFRELIASGDDNHRNQIRVSISGDVYLSQDITGAMQLDGVAFRLESFDAGNKYVGKEAAEDDRLVIPMYKAIKENWENGAKRTYIDDWNIK